MASKVALQVPVLVKRKYDTCGFTCLKWRNVIYTYSLCKFKFEAACCQVSCVACLEMLFLATNRIYSSYCRPSTVFQKSGHSDLWPRHHFAPDNCCSLGIFLFKTTANQRGNGQPAARLAATTMFTSENLTCLLVTQWLRSRIQYKSANPVGLGDP